MSADDQSCENIIHSFADDMGAKAKHAINVLMPKKILEIDELYKNLPAFSANLKSPIKLSNGELPPSKKRKLEDGAEAIETTFPLPGASIPCNKAIKRVIELLKPELTQLIELLSNIKIWIQLNIPQIEDGNNFGVQVQEDAVGELGRAESYAFSLLETIMRYSSGRGKLVSKMLKYPLIDDYKQAIIDYDEKEYLHLRMCVVDLRNNYAILYDLINKNRAKIEKPRSSHNQSLY